MIVMKKGSIFKSLCQALVNPVNCGGVMGAGLALSFKRRYPDMFHNYKFKCNRREVVIGQPYLFTGDTTDPWVINFPTKTRWDKPSKLEYIKVGMRHLVEGIEGWHVRSIAFPRLGCGLGGLDWDVVKPVILEELNKAEDDLLIEIYE